MATRFNTATTTKQAEDLGAIWNSGTLEIRTGTQPASANDVATGTLLQSITLPVTAFGAGAAGTVAKAGTWSSTVLATGDPGWARFISSVGDRRLDVSAGGPASGAQLVCSANTLIQNGVGTVDTFTLTMPETA